MHVARSRPWLMIHVVSRVVDAWLWGAAFYVLPLIALVWLVFTADGRRTRGDPEVQVSAL